jgi:putative hemolysin
MQQAAWAYLVPNFLLFVFALMMCAFFAFLETALTSLRLFKLKELARSLKSYTKFFEILEHNPHRILMTILVASNLANVTYVFITARLSEELFSYFNITGGLATTLTLALTTVAVTLFGEVLPKNLAKLYGERWLPYTLWLANLIFIILYPFVSVFSVCTDWLVHLVGNRGEVEHGPSEQEIQFLIGYINERGLMEPDKTEMLQNVFELGSTPVREIMVPATDMIMIEASIAIEEALGIFSKYQFSRLPVFSQRIDNVLGLLYQKDLLLILTKPHGAEKVKDIMRPVMFVPDSMMVNQLLRQFKSKQQHLAVVLDEYGSIVGLVTLEDVLEEIVGEIVDEHELVLQKVIKLKDDGWLVDASISLEDLSDVLKIDFPESDFISLGGFMVAKFQHLPKKGESFVYNDYIFQVQKASDRRVLQVFIMHE